MAAATPRAPSVRVAPRDDTGYVPIDLSPWLDNRGITSAGDRARGDLNLWGNSFAAECLPPRGARFRVGAIPFELARSRDAGDGDNVRCARQFVTIPRGRYDWLYLLAAAERRTEDAVHLHFADGAVDPAWLGVSDFWPETPSRFGERAAFTCDAMNYPRHAQRRFGPTIWRQRVPVAREAVLAAVHLPDNPAIHLFAMTAMRARVDDEGP